MLSSVEGGDSGGPHQPTSHQHPVHWREPNSALTREPDTSSPATRTQDLHQFMLAAIRFTPSCVQAFDYLGQGMASPASEGRWTLQASPCSAQLLLPMLLAGLDSSHETLRKAALGCLMALPQVGPPVHPGSVLVLVSLLWRLGKGSAPSAQLGPCCFPCHCKGAAAVLGIVQQAQILPRPLHPGQHKIATCAAAEDGRPARLRASGSAGPGRCLGQPSRGASGAWRSCCQAAPHLVHGACPGI